MVSPRDGTAAATEWTSIVLDWLGVPVTTDREVSEEIENAEAELIEERKSNFAKLDAQILFQEKICLPVNIRNYTVIVCLLFLHCIHNF